MFADIFNELLAENGMNRKKFSEQSGIPYPTIVGWTNLNRLPDFAALKKLADFFHCSVDFLMERQGSERSPYELEMIKQEKNFIDLYRGLNRENRELICQLMKNLMIRE